MFIEVKRDVDGEFAIILTK